MGVERQSAGEVKKSRANSLWVVEREFGFKAKTGFEGDLRKTIEWYILNVDKKWDMVDCHDK